MPRDAVGNLFGHGSQMRVCKPGRDFGKVITVVGFMTIVQGRIDIAKVKAAIGKRGQKFYRFTDLQNVDPREITDAAVSTTDHCAVDRAQVAGVFNEDDGGDKIIWGT